MNDRDQIAKILCENIHYSGQANDYIIHGAIEKIIEWQHGKEREFKLLVRRYFNARDMAISTSFIEHDGKTMAEAVLREAETEKEIRKELDRFTEQDVKELPFKD